VHGIIAAVTDQAIPRMASCNYSPMSAALRVRIALLAPSRGVMVSAQGKQGLAAPLQRSA
jgi:hypothetical protein